MGKQFIAFSTICCFFSFVLFGVSRATNIYDDGNNKLNPTSDEDQKIIKNNDQLFSMSSGEMGNVIKRAPNGFIGMRGKKELETKYNDLRWNTEPIDINDGVFWRKDKSLRKKLSENTINSIYFKEMDDLIKKLQLERLREEVLQGLADRESINYVDHGNEVDKRAPGGFIGMRGRRRLQSHLPFNTDEMPIWNGYEKQLMIDPINHLEYKRSPFWNFNSGGFSGIRGRRQSNNLRNKFIGVRGKRHLQSRNDGLSKEQRSTSTGNNARGQELFFNSNPDVYEPEQKTPSIGLKTDAPQQKW